MVPLGLSAQAVYDELSKAPLTTGEIALRVGLSSTNTGNHLNDLVADGLVVRAQARRGHAWATTEPEEPE
jgi:predicted ArsR family transcriptional regulator